LGILTLPDQAQIIFMDTPGIHIPHHRLGEFMNEVAEQTLLDADVIVWIVDGSVTPTEEDRVIAERMGSLPEAERPPVLLVLNKVDLIPHDQIPQYLVAYQELLPAAELFPISAITGYQREELLRQILERIPEGPPYYDPEQVTDLYEREIAADLIREAALVHLRDEIPHGVAVRIDEYSERGDTGAYVVGTLFVERESHKGIVIGKGGAMLKTIGTTARKEIEAMSGRKVFLELRVKVNKNWRSDPDALRLFGYYIEKE
jgi:GTP-binding protein Era